MLVHYLPSNRQNDTNIYTKEEIPILGIDFGTTNSVVSYYIDAPHFHGAKPVCHPQTGSMLFPSVVYYDVKSGFVSGQLAYQRRLLYPSKVVSSIKRNLLSEYVVLDGTKFTPLQLVAEIFKGLLVSVRNEYPKAKPQITTITVPYFFMQPQNLIIREAAEKAFWEIFGCYPQIEIIPEPVAASLFWLYKNQKQYQGKKTTLVFDLGGGTFDLSLVESILYPNRISCEVIAVDGCDQLGGNDMDAILYNYIVDNNDIEFGKLTEKEKMRLHCQIMDSVIAAKCELSSTTQANIIIELPSKLNISNIDCIINREDFESLLYESSFQKASFMSKIENCIDGMLKRKAVCNRTIDNIILVGGPTKMPIIQEFVQQKFPESNILLTSNNNEEFISVSQGAALYSALMSKDISSPFGENIREINYQTRIPHSIFIERYDHSLDLIIKEGATCPVLDRKYYYPTKLSNDGKHIELSRICLYQQRNGETPILVGSIDFNKNSLFAHGRSIDQIPILIEICADSTLIKVKGLVEKSLNDMSDFVFEEYIKL